MLRPRFWPTLMAGLGIVVLCGLGLWQLERREWKHALISDIETRSTAEPASIAELMRLAPEQRPFRHVRVSGFLVQQPFVRLYVTTKDGPGHRYIHALRLDEGGFLLVDLGFAPLNAPDVSAAPAEHVTLTGLMRVSEAADTFTPAPDLANRIFYVRDVPAMAASLDIAVFPDFALEAENMRPAFSGKWPRTGRATAEITDNHLQYALTWFALALVLGVIWVIYHWRPRGG